MQTLVTLETLQTFCGTDESRSYLLKPFSDDKWTYFTDGRIAIRVERIQPPTESPEEKLANALSKLHEYFAEDQSDGNYQPLPVEPPEGWAPECETCHGTGRACKVVCDCCGNEIILPVEIDCLDCDGAGKQYWNQAVQFGTQKVNAYYLKKLAILPDVTMACNKNGTGSEKFTGVLSITFDGGEGRLMPLKAQ